MFADHSSLSTEDIIEAFHVAGSYNGAARKLGVSHATVRRAVRGQRKKGQKRRRREGRLCSSCGEMPVFVAGGCRFLCQECYETAECGTLGGYELKGVRVAGI